MLFLLKEGVDFHGYSRIRRNVFREYIDFKKIVKRTDYGIRMHYVRRDDTTFEKLSELNYLFDTSEFNKKSGHCLKSPYKVGDMWEFPLCIMDGYLPKKINEKKEETKKKHIVFIAGGVGTAPVYPQVKWLHERGIDADVIVGAKTKDLLIMEEEMKAVAGNLYVTTDDGSYERKGMVTDVVKDLVNNQGKKYDVCVAIGPMIMMKFVALLTKELGIPTIVSLNPIMVDGTGMCGACRVTVGNEVKFACVDGPEFDGHLVNFDEAMKRQQMYKTEEGRAMLKLQEGATHKNGGCGCGGDK